MNPTRILTCMAAVLVVGSVVFAAKPATGKTVAAAIEKMTGALRGLGLRVPEDVAVIGCDDLTGDASFSPPLISPRQPMERIGEAAVELLLRRLAGEKSPAERHFFPPELIERESSATAKPRSTRR